MDKEKIYQDAFSTYGIDLQLNMAIEEMAELTQALSKLIRYRNTASASVEGMKKGESQYLVGKNIIEEVADVEIMLEQIKHIFVIDSEVKSIKNKKLERLVERIKQDDYKVERRAKLIEDAMVIEER